MSILRLTFYVILRLPTHECDYTRARADACVDTAINPFLEAIDDGTWFARLKTESSMFATAQMNYAAMEQEEDIEEEFPTSVPTTIVPSMIPTSVPTIDPTPMLVIVPRWAFAAFIVLCIICAIMLFKCCFTRDMNKVKILAMVNEVLEEEDYNREESKDEKNSRKRKKRPQSYDDEYYDDDESQYYSR